MLGKLFDRGAAEKAGTQSGPKVPRHSGGWATLRKQLMKEPGLRVLDVGSTSPANINFLTELGQSVYMADLVEDAKSGDWQRGEDEDGKPVWDAAGFVEQNLTFTGRQFDMILLWTTLDYLPEGLLAPVISGLYNAMVPKGQMFALFHTKLLPDEYPYQRFQLTETDEVMVQTARPAKQQRALTNRNIEKLFTEWSSLKQFLAKDGVSEAIITR